jgi:predicted metal-dependent peptidase
MKKENSMNAQEQNIKALLDKALVKVYSSDYSFVDNLKYISFKIDETIPTAVASIEKLDSSIPRYFIKVNPRFIMLMRDKYNLTDDDTVEFAKAIILHEYQHIVQGHLKFAFENKLKPNEMKVLNVASDASINKICFLNSNNKKIIRVCQEELIIPDTLRPIIKSNDKDFDNWSWIKYYEHLKNGNNGSDGEGIEKENQDEITYDENLTDADKEIIKHITKEIKRNYAKQHGYGSIEIEEDIEPKNAKIEKDVADLVNQMEWGLTYQRKHPLGYPLRYYPSTKRIVVFIDQSGSMGNEDLAKIFYILNQLKFKYNIETYAFDVDYKKIEKNRRVKIGGTDIQFLIQYLNDNPSDEVIIFTDGYLDFPEGLKNYSDRIAFVIIDEKGYIIESLKKNFIKYVIVNLDNYKI